jgi:hypothetical protein
MRTLRWLTGMGWAVVAGLGMLGGCGTSATSPDAGGGKVADGGIPDVPFVAADAGVDLAPDLMPDLMPDMGIPCGDGGDGGECTMALSCCSSFCVNTGTDPRNCGACGTACSTAQFCTGTACSELSFANVCANPNLIVLTDLYDTDNIAGRNIGAALTSSCMPAPALMEKSQVAEGVLDIVGRPLAGGSTSFVSGGGSFGQQIIQYLDKAGVTPAYVGGDADNVWFRVRMTDQNAVSAPRSTLNDSHDFFLVEVSAEPIGGSLSIAALGMFAPGTAAAGYFVPTEMIPKRASYPDAWYVFEWTDSGDKVPNAADTFTLVAHGR